MMETSPSTPVQSSHHTPTVLQWVMLGQALFLIFLASWYLFGRGATVDEAAGMNLNQRAWEASYTERGLPVPPGGPREGYWGNKLLSSAYDPDSVWRHAEQEIPGLVSIDANGFQHARSEKADAFKIMILGGSVAFGAYASDEAHAYFTRLRDLLAEKGIATDITVVAAGAWKTIQSTAAFRKHYDTVKPDMAIFFNGLNSMTVGANADTLFGQPTITREGRMRLAEDTEQDYDARAERYIERMIDAKKFASSQGIPLIVALQPAPFEKKTRSGLEMEIAKSYQTLYGSEEGLRDGYGIMRKTITSLCDDQMYFLDLSRAFDGEAATTFTDMWHFSDPGHEIVARRLSDFLAPIILQVR